MPLLPTGVHSGIVFQSILNANRQLLLIHFLKTNEKRWLFHAVLEDNPLTDI